MIRIRKYTMLWLAIMPVLSIYLAFPGFSWANIFLFFIIFIALHLYKNINLIFELSKLYIVFWAFVSFSFMVACMLHGPIYRALLPGGLAFCLFSLQLGFGTKFFDLNYFYKYARIIAIVTIVILVLQDLCYFFIGHRFSALLPFGELTDGIPMSELIQFQLILDRSSSIFREPAHAAQYLLVVLAIELFWKGRNKLYTNFGIFLGISLLILRSGNGLLGMLLLVMIKTFYYLKQNKSTYRYLIISVGILSCMTVVNYYGTTEVGSKTMRRISELENNESSKSYVRIYRGFALLSDSPVTIKLFGTNNDGIIDIIHNSRVAYLFKGDRVESDLYFNGVSSIILHTGLIGLFLFLIYVIKCQKGTGELPMTLSLLLLIISFIEATYLSSLMLTVCIIVNGEYFRYKRVLRSTSWNHYNVKIHCRPNAQ